MDMGRIKLSKRAKRVLRLLAEGVTECPADMDRKDFSLGALALKYEGLAVCHEEEGGDVVAAKLSTNGWLYLHGNRSPCKDHRQRESAVDWKFVLIIMLDLIAAAVCLALIAVRLHWI